MRVLIIGKPPRNSAINAALMNDVSNTVKGQGVHVHSCQNRAELLSVAQRLGEGAGKISMLDIFDHGRPGEQHLGDEILFESRADPCAPLIGENVARALVPHLSDTAQVRLLGCRTAEEEKQRTTRNVFNAEGDSGRMLLVKLALLLGGHRIVFGTIGPINLADFDAQGFLVSQERGCLFSSAAALDGAAPSVEDRVKHLGELSKVLC